MFRRIIYVLFRLVRRTLPGWLTHALYARQRMIDERFRQQFVNYRDILVAQGIDPSGKKILEVGAGTNSPSAAAFLLLNAGSVLLHEPHYRGFDRLEVARGTKMIADWEGSCHLSTEKILGLIDKRLSYSQCSAEYSGLEDKSIDVVLSCDVLEYIPDPLHAFREQQRILKVGGAAVHIIDLRDHFFCFPFEMLTFSRFVWEKVLTKLKKGGGYQNRLRIDDYLRIARLAGFCRIEFKILQSNLDQYLKVKPRLHKDYQGREDNLMAAQRAAICLFR